jgi:predicted ATPase/DNA-binding SARP family transcriptional activator
MLGTVEVEVEGRIVPLPTKARAIASLLALADGRVVSVDQAVDGIWGEAAPPSARNALQVHVSTLRRALGASGAAVRTHPGGYLLACDEVDVDVWRFRGLVGRAWPHGPASAPLLREATTLWRGAPMADLADVPFVQAVATSLTEEYLVALERRIDLDLSGGNLAELIIELDLLVRQHPYREGFWYRLVLALYRDGRQAHALDAFQRARAVLREELGLDPGPSLQALEQAVLRQDPALAPVPVVETLAALPDLPLTDFIGREDAVAGLVDLLATARLVTVSGPGGVGKTRLALEVAHRMAESAVDAAVFVDLSDIVDPGLAGAAVARALGLSSPNPWAAVQEYLGRASVLVVIDNAEQVADGLAERVSSLARRANTSRILVTSRVVLRVGDERVWPLSPLSTSEAERLFLNRARVVQPDRQLEPSAVEELCRRLDGLPLALEIVAARCRTMSPVELVRRFDDVIRADARAPSTPEHHRSVLGSVRWSVDLLAPGPRQLLGTLGVFSSGFTFEAAAAVYDKPTLNDLDELVEASLVVTDGVHLRMLETVRMVARELLTSREDVDLIRQRHATWVTDASTAITKEAPDQAVNRASERMRVILDECLSAVGFLIDTHRNVDAAELFLRCAPAWSRSRDDAELTRSLAWLTRLEQCSLPEPIAVRVMLHRQDRLYFSGRKAESLAEARRAYELAGSVGDHWGTARACHALAFRAALDGDFDLARERCAHGAAAAQLAGDESLRADFENILGCVAIDEKDYGAAAEHLSAFVASKRIHDAAGVCTGLANLVDAALVTGRSDDARRVAAELWLEFPADADSVTVNLGYVAHGLAALAGRDLGRAAEDFAQALDRRLTDGYKTGLAAEIIGIADAVWHSGDNDTAQTLFRTCNQLRQHEPAVGSEWAAADLLENELRNCLSAADIPGAVGVGVGDVEMRDWRAVAAYAAGVGHRLAREL